MRDLYVASELQSYDYVKNRLQHKLNNKTKNRYVNYEICS